MAQNKNIGLNYGLISGLASILFGLLLYVMGAKWFVHPVAYFGMLLPIVIAVLAGNKQKQLNGGYLEFGEALKVVFLTFVVGAFISSLFNYVLFNFVDPGFRDAVSQEVVVKAQQMMEKFGAPEDQIEKATTDMMNKNNYSLGNVLLSAAMSCIVFFVFSLIIAAIIKKKKPEFPTIGQP